MKYRIFIFVAVCLSLAAVSCTEKEQDTGLFRPGTFGLTIDEAVMPVYESQSPLKSSFVDNPSLKWTLGDKVFVFDKTGCLGTLEVTELVDEDGLVARLAGTDLGTSWSDNLTLIHSNGLSAAPDIDGEGRISIDISNLTEGADAANRFVAVATIANPGESMNGTTRSAVFKFATSMLRVYATAGVNFDGTATAILEGVNTACILSIDETGIATVAGDSLGRAVAGVVNVAKRGVLAATFSMAVTDDASSATAFFSQGAGKYESAVGFPGPVKASGFYTTGFSIESSPEAPSEDAGVRLWEDGPFWAPYNVGAAHNSPADYGWYFSWGDVQGYERNVEDGKLHNVITGAEIAPDGFAWASYKRFGRYEDSAPDYGFTRYNSNGPLVLNVYTDDAASANWGGHWRMPTKEEFLTLCESCTMEWTDDYDGTGVAGRIFTGKGAYSGNSIFFPAAGSCSGTETLEAGSAGSYWSGTLDSDKAYCALDMGFQSGSVFPQESCCRNLGFSVRPVWLTRVESITLNVTSKSIVPGASYTLTATVSPEDAINKTMAWSSSNNNVATVDENGKVFAVALGEAIITAAATDGSGKTATCTVTVEYDVVEIGGLTWSTMNLGAISIADNPETAYGDYYAWGAAELAYDNLDYYICYLEDEPSFTFLTDRPSGNTDKYPNWNPDPYEGGFCSENTPYCDFNTYTYSKYTSWPATLESPEDDAVGKAWGDGWRMPTVTDFRNLFEACGGEGDEGYPEMIEDAVIVGGKVTSKGIYWCEPEPEGLPYIKVSGMLFSDGNANLFFPAAGNGNGVYLQESFVPSPPMLQLRNNGPSLRIASGIVGYYWSSSLAPLADFNGDPDCAYSMYADEGYVCPTNEGTRCFGYSVRPVWSQPVRGIVLDIAAKTIAPDDNFTVTATVSPADASRNVTFSSDKPEVAVVDAYTGEVTGVAVGKATITVTAADGSGVTAACIVTVRDIETSINGYWAVQLWPCGPWWATCNIGAENPGDNGYYFMWGDVQGYEYKNIGSGYKFYKAGGNERMATYGFADVNAPYSAGGYKAKYTGIDEIILDLADDAASQGWGGSWRVPATDELIALVTNCYWEWTDSYTGTGAAGFIVYRAEAGDAGYCKFSDALKKWNGSSYGRNDGHSISASYDLSCHHIFLPAAGNGIESYFFSGSGFYWSNELFSDIRSLAFNLDFDSTEINPKHESERSYGYSVRPISD